MDSDVLRGRERAPLLTPVSKLASTRGHIHTGHTPRLLNMPTEFHLASLLTKGLQLSQVEARLAWERTARTH